MFILPWYKTNQKIISKLGNCLSIIRFRNFVLKATLCIFIPSLIISEFWRSILRIDLGLYFPNVFLSELSHWAGRSVDSEFIILLSLIPAFQEWLFNLKFLSTFLPFYRHLQNCCKVALVRNVLHQVLANL